ncbi:hypothetical protein GWG65_30735 [Bradyrhizobium sp. CSA207]|uniref:hypothetical protein n=1 Tax=Bradyrhizobium sp. CSA207 TaxID=2698826 RepID=UPI0023AF8E72|nr:hypothetical protein [Bradyrhizobium sp. CSA207]MDE5445709.1 hypothetical protein [Bradyrhizobium sp. CSA207]
MIDQRRNAPRRYFVDRQGHRVLIGLSLDETSEFEALDLPSTNVDHAVVEQGVSGAAVAAGEIRWLELYSKHEGAWRAWIAQSRAGEADNSDFVNYV